MLNTKEKDHVKVDNVDFLMLCHQSIFGENISQEDSKIESLIENLDGNKGWCHLYELSQSELKQHAFKAVGLESMLRDPEKLKKLLHETLKKGRETGDSPLTRAIMDGDTTELLINSIASWYNIKSIRVNDISISEVVNRIKQSSNDCDDLLFKSILIDPTVIYTPTVSKLSVEKFKENDRAFLKKLAKSLSPDAGKRKQNHIMIVRFFIHALHRVYKRLPDPDEMVEINRKYNLVKEGVDTYEMFRHHIREYVKYSRRIKRDISS